MSGKSILASCILRTSFQQARMSNVVEHFILLVHKSASSPHQQACCLVMYNHHSPPHL